MADHPLSVFALVGRAAGKGTAPRGPAGRKGGRPGSPKKGRAGAGGAQGLSWVWGVLGWVFGVVGWSRWVVMDLRSVPDRRVSQKCLLSILSGDRGGGR